MNLCRSGNGVGVLEKFWSLFQPEERANLGHGQGPCKESWGGLIEALFSRLLLEGPHASSLSAPDPRRMLVTMRNSYPALVCCIWA